MEWELRIKGSTATSDYAKDLWDEVANYLPSEPSTDGLAMEVAFSLRLGVEDSTINELLAVRSHR